MKNKNLIYCIFAFISLCGFLTVSAEDVNEREKNTPYLFRGESIQTGESLCLYSDNSEWDKIELVVKSNERVILYLHQKGEKIRVWDSSVKISRDPKVLMTPSGKFAISNGADLDNLYSELLGYEAYFWKAIHRNVPGSFLAIEKTVDSARIAIYSPTHELLWDSETGDYTSVVDYM